MRKRDVTPLNTGKLEIVVYQDGKTPNRQYLIKKEQGWLRMEKFNTDSKRQT